MIDFKLDPITRDMVFGTSSRGATLIPLDGAERVAQAIGIRLRTWLGEWFLNATHGVPYVDEVLGKGRRPEMVEAVLRAQILGVAGVRSIQRFSLSLNAQARTVRVDFAAVSAEGLVSGTVALG
jgi:hypothetical protein